ncbi:uncharacterized protein LOC101243342 [Ciona intestinalis]
MEDFNDEINKELELIDLESVKSDFSESEDEYDNIETEFEPLKENKWLDLFIAKTSEQSQKYEAVICDAETTLIEARHKVNKCVDQDSGANTASDLLSEDTEINEEILSSHGINDDGIKEKGDSSDVFQVDESKVGLNVVKQPVEHFDEEVSRKQHNELLGQINSIEADRLAVEQNLNQALQAELSVLKNLQLERLKLLDLKEENAVILIQRHYRGYIVRKIYASILETKIRESREKRSLERIVKFEREMKEKKEKESRLKRMEQEKEEKLRKLEEERIKKEEKKKEEERVRRQKEVEEHERIQEEKMKKEEEKLMQEKLKKANEEEKQRKDIEKRVEEEEKLMQEKLKKVQEKEKLLIEQKKKKEQEDKKREEKARKENSENNFIQPQPNIPTEGKNVKGDSAYTSVVKGGTEPISGVNFELKSGREFDGTHELSPETFTNKGFEVGQGRSENSASCVDFKPKVMTSDEKCQTDVSSRVETGEVNLNKILEKVDDGDCVGMEKKITLLEFLAETSCGALDGDKMDKNFKKKLGVQVDSDAATKSSSFHESHENVVGKVQFNTPSTTEECCVVDTAGQTQFNSASTNSVLVRDDLKSSESYIENTVRRKSQDIDESAELKPANCDSSLSSLDRENFVINCMKLWKEQCITWNPARVLEHSTERKRTPHYSTLEGIPERCIVNGVWPNHVENSSRKLENLLQVFIHASRELHGKEWSLRSLESCENLTHVTLVRCGLASLHGIQCCRNLKHIDVSHNKISSLPLDGMFRIKSLVAARNHLTSTNGVQGCTGLVHCDLSHNNITKITGVEDCIDLTHLNLSNNQLIKLSGLENSKHLVFLELSNNHLSSMHGLNACGLLRYLDVSSNNFMKLVFKQLGNLVLLDHLNLSRNNICEVKLDTETSYIWLPCLTQLDLSRNKISEDTFQVSTLKTMPQLQCHSYRWCWFENKISCQENQNKEFQESFSKPTKDKQEQTVQKPSLIEDVTKVKLPAAVKIQVMKLV